MSRLPVRPSLYPACVMALLIFLSLAIPLADAAPLLLDKPQPYSLAGHLESLVDPGGTLTLKDLLSGKTSARFVPLSGFVNYGFISSASWTRFTYQPSANDNSGDLFLRLTPAFLDEVTLYVQAGPDPALPASYREYNLGDHYPGDLRRIRHPDMVAPLPSTPGVPRQVYIRVKSTSTHTLQGWLYPRDDLINWSASSNLWMGGLLGIILFDLVISALLALMLRNVLFGYYSLFALTFFIRQLGIDGAMFVLWPSVAHLTNDYLVGGGISLGLCAYSLFVMRLFNTDKEWPMAHRLLRLSIVIGGANALGIPLGWYGRLAPVTTINYLLLACFIPVLAYRYLRRGAPAGGWIIAGFSVVLIPAVPRFIVVLGLMSPSWFTTYGYYYGMIIHMVMITLALVKRLELSRELLLSASRRTEAVAVELAEEMTGELREALKRQTRFVAMVCHEYRTPLAIIRANLDLLALLQDQDENISFAVVKMKRAVARLVEVLEVSLGRVRLSDGTLTLRPEPLELERLCSGLLEQATEYWPDRQVVVVPGDVAVVQGDPLLLQTALLNLVDNGLKYSPPDSPVTLSWTVADNEVVIRVEDHGSGVSPEEQERLFEKYFRGSAATGTVGAGLGLWLVARIVEEHGGSVLLKSSATGAVAVIRLPLKELSP